MADCDFCNLGDCVRRDAVRKFETTVVLTIKTLVYVCAIAGGVFFGGCEKGMGVKDAET